MQEVTELSGWAVTLLFCVTVVLPFWYRWRSPDADAFLARMRTHFSIGFGIAALSLLHAVLAVSSLAGGSPYLVGLAVATLGLFTAFGQVALGLQLRRRRGRYHGWLIAAHVGTMLALAVLGAIHLVLDGPFTRCFLHLAGCPA
jgi:hypothetical protein